MGPREPFAINDCRARRHNHTKSTMHRWKLSALAAAAFVSAALTPTDASALALGRITVQSALGEPLRAEIEVPQATAAELEALQAGIATPDIFKAQGMEYSSAARQIRVDIVRQPDGTAKLKLSSRNPVTDPFVDLVVDANWSAGHLVRSYTLLLDPPAATAQPAPVPVTAAQTSPSRAPATPASTGRTYRSDGAAPPPSAAPAAAAATSSGSDRTTVRAGDTAGRLAQANRPAGVSLDQMLVAMLRANPDAFISGNVNRIRAGSVVQLPSKEQATATTAKEARQIVAAQSRDFNEFRRRLAAKAPAAKVAAAERTSSGQVQAQVQDHSAGNPAADKLTLSKGALSAHAAEEKLAKDKQANAQADRVGELQRNLAELQQVATASSPATTAPAAAADAPAATAPAAATPGVTVPVTTPLTTPSAEASATPASDAAPTAANATAAAPETPAPAAAAPAAPQPTAVKPALTPPAPAPEPGFLEELTGDNPLILPAAGGALALLLGLLGWRTVQRRRGQAAAEALAADQPPPPDSFFGHSGGQQIDTRQSSVPAASSTMAYSPSQLDAGGDVDPVAEAEVYLAYGRDVQAEEILKEALRTQPERLGVHMKLAEIYAKRQDTKAFEATALAVQPLTQGAGPSWERIVELGQTVDASNPLYQGPEAPSTSAFADALAKSHALPAASAAMASTTLGQHLPADLDLSLDMDLPGGLSDAEALDVAGPASVLTPSEQDFAALEPNWNSVAASPPPAPKADAPAVVPEPLDLSSLEFALDDANSPAPATPVAEAVATSPDFDLGDLDLDLGDTPAAPAAAPTVPDDPLSTKLDLAREFNAIGDSEGARTLVEEVIAEASGDLKERAQHLLSEID